MTASGRPSSELPRAGLRQAIRISALGLLVIGVAAAWHWRAALDPAAVAATIGRYPAAPLIYLAIHIAASLLFVPRTLLAILAGLLFGIGSGIFWATIGSVAGAVAGFLVARYLNSGLFGLDRNARVRPVLDRVERGGWRAVALLRLIPVMPHSLGNYGLGLTRMPLGAYAFGSLLGQLPMTIAYVDFGAAGERVMLGSADWLAPAAFGAAALALSLLIPAIARRRAG
ncbi:MAG: TVP38/TMEM64 family protein [Stellaceae bacterium]